MRYFRMLLLVALTGCTLYHVSDKPMSGVPFFPIETVGTTKVAYAQTWYELTLETTWVPADAPPAATTASARGSTPPKPEEKKEPPKFSTTQVRYATDPVVADIVFEAFNEARTPVQAIEQVKAEFGGAPKSTAISAPPPRIAFDDFCVGFDFVGVERGREQRPSATPLYINVRRPLSGSASGNIGLNENGTLASAEASIESDTLSQIVAATSLTSATSTVATAAGDVLGGLVKSFGVGAEPGKEPKLLSAKLTKKQVQRVYTVKLEHKVGEAPEVLAPGTPTNPPGHGLPPGACPAVGPALKAGTATVTVAERRGDDGDDKKDDAEDRTLHITGSVVLPKESDDADGDDDK